MTLDVLTTTAPTAAVTCMRPGARGAVLATTTTTTATAPEAGLD